MWEVEVREVSRVDSRPWFQQLDNIMLLTGQVTMDMDHFRGENVMFGWR